MKLDLRATARLLPLLSALTLIAACGGDDHDHGAGENPGAEGCEHLGMASTPLIASAMPGGAPALTAHQNHEVALADNPGGGKLGYVSFTTSKAATLHVFLGAAVPLKTSTASGSELTAKPLKTLPCAAIKAWYEYDVGVGRVDLALGSAGNSVAKVNLVVEAQAQD